MAERPPPSPRPAPPARRAAASRRARSSDTRPGQAADQATGAGATGRGTEPAGGRGPARPFGRDLSRIRPRRDSLGEGPLDDRGERAAAPDAVTAGEALARLVDRLLGRDPAGQTGGLTAVLGRLDGSLREAVVATVAQRGGGHVATDLAALTETTPPEQTAPAREPAPEPGTSGKDPAAEEATGKDAGAGESGPLEEPGRQPLDRLDG
ncbi:hypothetical protein I6A84_08240, partial [Frankia sp. CNm7]